MVNELSDEKIRHAKNDADFDELYPVPIQLLASRHWTPIHIARLATDFMATEPGSKILDIGSGVGKFCMAGAYYANDAHFYGVEQRIHLINHAVDAQKKLGLKNVSFIHSNFTQVDIRRFDHIYFFNSFFENLHDVDRIDEDIDYSEALYDYYVRYLRNGLKQMPKGTKVVTYHSLQEEIPRGYHLVDTLENGALNFWVKA